MLQILTVTHTRMQATHITLYVEIITIQKQI